MAVNKVILGSETLLDLTGDTATAADVAEGKTFHLASGVQTVGTASASGVSVFYGTCATAAATAAKVVTCEDFTSSDLVEGTVINVKFTYAQTYNGAPTLNVNGTGAKNVKRVGSTNAARYEWQAGEVLQFVYDGSYWMLTDGGIATTTYYGVTKLSSATNSTSNALAATASAVKAAYDHADGKQDALVSGTSIKTINGTSLLGSGNISTAELPSVTAADNGKVLMVVDGIWQVVSLPIASDNAFGVVKVDGTTITATDGVISTAGGAETYEVTITLTNPQNSRYFSNVEVSECENGSAYDSSVSPLGNITSPTGSQSYVMSKPYCIVSPQGSGAPSVDESMCTCTGGASFFAMDGTAGVFLITSDGTITIDGIDYDG